MSDELKIEFDLKYPLHLRRFRNEERIGILDSAGFPVATALNYNHAYEIVILANSAYRLLSDLSKKPYENPAPANNRQDPD
jgi:hypothetical protein